MENSSTTWFTPVMNTQIQHRSFWTLARCGALWHPKMRSWQQHWHMNVLSELPKMIHQMTRSALRSIMLLESPSTFFSLILLRLEL